MKIVSNKEYQKLKTNKKINDYLARGHRANHLSLSFEKAIVEIMKRFNVEEIELSQNYIMNDEYLEISESKNPCSFIIKVVKGDIKNGFN